MVIGLARLVAVAACVIVLTGCTRSETKDAVTDPPTAEVDNPWTQVVTCLEDAGYPGFVANSDGITAPPGSSDDEEQFKLLLAAESQCADEAGFYSGPIPDDELPRLYALELEEIECLHGLGYETPEPPSLQTFIDDYSSGTPWEAAFELYFSLPLSEQTEDALNRINTECPPPASRFTRD